MGAVLITGASRGIGKAIALKFAENGYDIIITCKNSINALNEVKNEILAKNVKCLACIADVAVALDIHNLFNDIQSFTNELIAVINNAGISHIGLLQDMTDYEWDNVIQTNLSSAFYVSRAAIPIFLKRKKGNIINISSIWGVSGASCEVAYSASKGGINAFTKALARELAPSNIRVNAIACGVIDTSMNQFLDDESMNGLINEIGAGRLGKPQEIANVVYFMISDDASYINGQILTVDGSLI